MPFVLETIVATKNADGSFHIRPYGLHRDGDDWLFLPFRPSPAIGNLQRHPFAVVSAPADVRILAGFLTGRTDFASVAADRVDGVRLADCFGHMELEVASFTDDEVRPAFRCRVVHQAAHRPFLGYNRAQAAVLEAAILSTRLTMLPRAKIETEMALHRTAVEKTAGPAEREAWDWIAEKIDGFYRDAS
ncbi:DUF447 domain-containing protein [Methylobrevis pamukkalensis]|uniref:Tetrahydromethanopterin synthesis protein n=1 Tax=Methylobrevis pamukkalensis TaxID=1439726 RepID=A0A1E3H6C8_9HYPH|nr:DUF447 domain-containing protein [Methylobrevis pamukkalensis]ODN71346.1 hypothetical protein A6302_01298 [Methylobrevis pamukkalensis]